MTILLTICLMSLAAALTLLWLYIGLKSVLKKETNKMFADIDSRVETWNNHIKKAKKLNLPAEKIEEYKAYRDFWFGQRVGIYNLLVKINGQKQREERKVQQ